MLSSGYMFMMFLVFNEAAVKLQYIYKSEHNSTIYYVFKCETIAQTIQWDINLFPIGGFNSGQAGTVLTNSRSNFRYSAVLLSSLKSGEAHAFSSMLIIYSPKVTMLNIACFNQEEGNYTSNSYTAPVYSESNITISDNSNTLVLSHLFTTKNEEEQTKNSTIVLLCNVNNDFQSWEVNSDLPFGFSVLNSIGDTIPSPKAGLDSTELIAFLTEQRSRSLTTVLILTEISSANVTCASGLETATLYITNQKQEANPTITESFKTEALNLTNTDTTLLSIMSATQLMEQIDSSHDAIAASVTPTIILIGVVIVVIIVFLLRNRKNKTGVSGGTNGLLHPQEELRSSKLSTRDTMIDSRKNADNDCVEPKEDSWQNRILLEHLPFSMEYEDLSNDMCTSTTHIEEISTVV